MDSDSCALLRRLLALLNVGAMPWLEGCYPGNAKRACL